jgi:hypothetical protein
VASAELISKSPNPTLRPRSRFAMKIAVEKFGGLERDLMFVREHVGKREA